jgi:hypothetical protein
MFSENNATLNGIPCILKQGSGKESQKEPRATVTDVYIIEGMCHNIDMNGESKGVSRNNVNL